MLRELGIIFPDEQEATNTLKEGVTSTLEERVTNTLEEGETNTLEERVRLLKKKE